MNPAETASEVLNWASTQPLTAVVAVAGVVGVGWVAARKLIANHAVHKANRGEVNAILNRHPPIARIQLPTDPR